MVVGGNLYAVFHIRLWQTSCISITLFRKEDRTMFLQLQVTGTIRGANQWDLPLPRDQSWAMETTASCIHLSPILNVNSRRGRFT